MPKLIDMTNKFMNELKKVDPEVHKQVLDEVRRKTTEELVLAFGVSIITGGPNPDYTSIATQMSLMYVLLERKDEAAKKFLERILTVEIQVEEMLKADDKPCDCPACTAEREEQNQLSLH